MSPFWKNVSAAALGTVVATILVTAAKAGIDAARAALAKKG